MQHCSTNARAASSEDPTGSIAAGTQLQGEVKPGDASGIGGAPEPTDGSVGEVCPSSSGPQYAAPPLPCTVFLHCPECSFAVDGTRAAFNLATLHQRTWCSRCQRSKFVRLWTCSCKVQWHTCPRHSMEPARLRLARCTASATTTTSTVGRRVREASNPKVITDISTIQWLDLATARPRRPHNPTVHFSSEEVRKVDSRVMAIQLGPTLRERFPERAQ